ncbi:MAG: hypothetical protein NTW96_24955 [Planctomycetia bacterium]|nr:hypothetical protein [Planctomycetia bacterium]
MTRRASRRRDQPGVNEAVPWWGDNPADDATVCCCGRNVNHPRLHIRLLRASEGKRRSHATACFVLK